MMILWVYVKILSSRLYTDRYIVYVFCISLSKIEWCFTTLYIYILFLNYPVVFIDLYMPFFLS